MQKIDNGKLVDLTEGQRIEANTPLYTREELLTNIREISTLTRSEFCLGLVSIGLLDASDAIETSKGEWPKSMTSFLSFLDRRQATEAQIEWAGATSINRTHPFVLSLASWLGMEDAQVDDLFGIKLPPE